MAYPFDVSLDSVEAILRMLAFLLGIDWAVVWVALGSIATLLAVVVALVIAMWGPQLQALASKPELKVSIDMRPPDCMKMLAILDSGPQRTTSYTPSYQCRLRITNDGKREARNVEVKLRKLQIVPNGGPGRQDQTFIPMNLKWAHTDELPQSEKITAKRIEPNLDKHCNLCSTTEYGKTNPLLKFETEVDPTPIQNGVFANRKPPGNYLLDLVVAADNARAVYKTFHIKFEGWIDDQDEMFRRGLVITPAN